MIHAYYSNLGWVMLDVTVPNSQWLIWFLIHLKSNASFAG